MAATADKFLPNDPGTGSIGDASNPWASGYFNALFLNGAQVAPLASPTFTGTPTGPSPADDDDSTRLATTAWARIYGETLVNRDNHTGTQLAETISDFAAAVADTNAGTKAHDQNSDTILDEGNANEVTAAALRTHLDDDDIHTPLDDSATDGAHVLSAAKIIALIETAFGEGGVIEIGDITGAGDLAALDTVDTAQIDDEAVTSVKLEGGEASPTARKYYGTDGAGAKGFHALAANIPLVSVAAAGQGLLDVTDDELHAIVGTNPGELAAGNDARFPTAGEKAALGAATGAASAENPYLSQSWATARSLTASDVDGADETDKLVSGETMAEVLAGYLKPDEVSNGDRVDGDVIDLDYDPDHYTPSTTDTDAEDAADLAAHLKGIDAKLAEIDGKLSSEDLEDGTLLDGDKIDIDFEPSNYNATTTDVDEVDDVDDLSAHLKGIDNKLGELEVGATPDADGDILEIDYVPSNYTRTPGGVSVDVKDLSAHLAGINAQLAYTSGSALDGDKIDIDWAPGNYTPDASIAEADDTGDLAAHLKGIDDALGSGVGGGSGIQAYVFNVLDQSERWGAAIIAGDYHFVTRIQDAGELVAVGLSVAEANVNQGYLQLYRNGLYEGSKRLFTSAVTFNPRQKVLQASMNQGAFVGGTGYNLAASDLIQCHATLSGATGASEGPKGLQIIFYYRPS